MVATHGREVPGRLEEREWAREFEDQGADHQLCEGVVCVGHRAAASLTTENMLEPLGQSKATRLRRATFGVAHAYDHYGQMVEYMRMNGIVPPASRGQQ